MRTNLFFIILSGFLLTSFQAIGQEAFERENVAIRGNVQENTVRLRWAPTNSKAWLEGKKYGYVLEKMVAFKNGQFELGHHPEKINRSFLPAPLNDWEELLHTSDYAAVIAQALYGDVFLLDIPSGDYGDIINQSTELEQRFATSLFSAEYDYDAALLAGWGWTDTEVKENERYLYRIYLNKPEPEKGDTAVIVIGLSDKKQLPKPIGINVICGDRQAMLSWNYFYQSDTYHSYHIERAVSGSDFQQITEIPVTAIGEDMQQMYYVDSLPDNALTYLYRIKGVTSFNETGPYSDEVSCKGKETVNCVPVITAGDFIAKDTAHIYWLLECNTIDMIKKVEIKRAPEIDGEYQTILSNIPPRQQELTLTLPEKMNYVRIHVSDQEGAEKISFPFLLQQVDSIPPAVPSGLEVSIDSVGVAHLSWNMNTEEDLRGYRLLRSFTEEAEKSSITSQFLTQNEYTDTLSLYLSNEAVYYALTAVDTYYNESQPCKTVKALKPNIATPADPVITGYKTDKNKVWISWITDTKDPLVTYYLMRSVTTPKQNDKVVYSGNYTINEYTDELPETGVYTYRVMAVAANKKVSYSPQEITLNIQVEENQDAVSGFRYYKDEKNNYIELSWSKHPQAKLYRLYKSEDDGNITLLKELDATQNRFVDEQVSPSVKYTYYIMFQSKADKNSNSKNITVNF
jgi:hypothetical protein